MNLFDSAYITKQLQQINTSLSESIDLYIFGGGAMSYYGLKTATKDIDVLLTSNDAASSLSTALQRLGYKNTEEKDEIYIKMKTRAIIENTDGFRWDIFVHKICGGLRFSTGMQQRANAFTTYTKLRTFLLSPEDIFILKAVTSRPRDREDMFSLFSHGLDISIIKQEIIKQTQYDKERAWLSYFFIGLDELVQEYHVKFPEYKEFLRLAEEEMIESLIIEFIQRKPRTLNQISSLLKINKKELQPILDEYIKKDKIKHIHGKYHLK